MSDIDPAVMVFRKGTVTDPSKAALRKAGIIVVEVDGDPREVKFMRPGLEVQGGTLLWAAMRAINASQGGTPEKRVFAEAVAQSVLAEKPHE